jgi:hypothetical protein
MNQLLTTMLFAFGVAAQAAGAMYYVDATDGNDANSGLSPRLAWKSLTKVNETTFLAGDKILFKRGTQYTGQFCPRGSGRDATARARYSIRCWSATSSTGRSVPWR